MPFLRACFSLGGRGGAGGGRREAEERYGVKFHHTSHPQDHGALQMPVHSPGLRVPCLEVRVSGGYLCKSNCVLQRHAEVLIPGLQNVNLFGNRVFPRIIK